MDAFQVGRSAEDRFSEHRALLVVLETLSPLERAVFVLREAFGGGLAGLTAAIACAEHGARVTLYEAHGTLGGLPRWAPGRSPGPATISLPGSSSRR